MRPRRCTAALQKVLQALQAAPVAAGLLCTSVAAGERPPPDDFQRFELRLGGFVHDSLSPERGSADINAEALFAPFDRTSNWLIPRLHVGATVNTAGKTSIAYAGFTWTYDLSRRVFIEGAFGGALNNGSTGPVPVPGRNAMGCAATFHEAASVGYRVTGAFSLLATVEHSSNAGLCRQNRGLTNFGIRAAYAF